MIKRVVTVATSHRLWAGCAVLSLLSLAACQPETAVGPYNEVPAALDRSSPGRFYSGQAAGRPDKKVPADSVRLFDDPPVQPGGPGGGH